MASAQGPGKVNMGKIKSVIKKRHIWQFLLIFIGTGIMAFGIQTIYDPANLVTGGFSGLAIVIKYVTGPLLKDCPVAMFQNGIPLWFTNFALNIPVFIVAYFVLGKRFIGRTLFGTLMLSAWLYIIPVYDIPQNDLLIAAVFGGVFSGGGIGLVLRANATTGGTDMVSAIIHRKFIRHYNVAEIMQIIDGIVVIIGLLVFGIRPTLYAVIAIFVTTKTSDLILEGFKFSRGAFIISDHYEEISQMIFRDLDRGITGIHAKGMYTDSEKCMLYCVVAKKEIPTLKEIVAEVDKDAFVIVSDVREVLGEGFQDHQ